MLACEGGKKADSFFNIMLGNIEFAVLDNDLAFIQASLLMR